MNNNDTKLAFYIVTLLFVVVIIAIYCIYNYNMTDLHVKFPQQIIEKAK